MRRSHLIKFSKEIISFLSQFQGRELIHNVQKKVIISNQSLVLQKVTRSDSGVYTCTAHNAEGDGMSNSINLDVRCELVKTKFHWNSFHTFVLKKN